MGHLFIIQRLLIATILARDFINAQQISNIDHDISHVENTCNSADLDHSPLVECGVSNCNNVSNMSNSLWPMSKNDIVHIYSTRLGDRFATDTLANLYYQETEEQRLFDINTTLYVDTETKFQKIEGFGTTVVIDDLLSLMNSHPEHFDKTVGLIFKDLIGRSHRGLNFAILRLPLTKYSIANSNITVLIKKIDELASREVIRENNDKIRVILSIEDLEKDSIFTLDAISAAFKSLRALSCWANLFSTRIVFGLSRYGDSPAFVDRLGVENIMRGLMIKSEFSSPYSILDYVHQFNGNLSLLSISSDRPMITDCGNWQNAQNFAVELLNHFKHGSNGFLEESSYAEILNNRAAKDSSIYSLHSSHRLHFRGPIFYAMGHFSRHILPGSRRLKVDLTTQPNMFAAHYSAFMTPHKDVVAIILNNNEHILPFRLSIDGTIVTNIGIKPKSFNTIIIKTQ